MLREELYINVNTKELQTDKSQLPTTINKKHILAIAVIVVIKSRVRKLLIFTKPNLPSLK